MSIALQVLYRNLRARDDGDDVLELPPNFDSWFAGHCGRTYCSRATNVNELRPDPLDAFFRDASSRFNVVGTRCGI